MSVTVIDDFTRQIAFWSQIDTEQAYLETLDALDMRATSAIELLYDAVIPELASNLSKMERRGAHEWEGLAKLAAYLKRDSDESEGSFVDMDNPDDREWDWSVDEFTWRPAATTATLALLRTAVHCFVRHESERQEFLYEAIQEWDVGRSPSWTTSTREWPTLSRKLMDGDLWEQLKLSSGMRSDEDLEVTLHAAGQALSGSELLRRGLSVVFRDHFLRFASENDQLTLTLLVPFLFNVEQPLEVLWDGGDQSVEPGTALLVVESIDTPLISSDGQDIAKEWLGCNLYKQAPDWFAHPPEAMQLVAPRLTIGEHAYA